MTPRTPARRTAAVPAESEKQFQDAFFVPLFTSLGYKGYHTRDSRRSASGFPDWILVRGPRLIAVELKSNAGALTREQVHWLFALEGAGVETRVWRPSDKQQIAKVLR